MKTTKRIYIKLSFAAWTAFLFAAHYPSFAQNSNPWSIPQNTPKVNADPNVPVGRGYLIPSTEEAPGGAKVKVDIYHTTKDDGVSLYLQTQINDGKGQSHTINLMQLDDKAKTNPTDFVSHREFNVNYDELNKVLAKHSPNFKEKIGPGTILYVAGMWDVGHQWGGISRGGAIIMPGDSSKFVKPTNSAAIARPTELDLAFPITDTLANPYNDAHTGSGIKVGGQIRSRVEGEGKFQLPLKDMPDIKKKLFEMSDDPAKAAAVLGPDWSFHLESRYLQKDAQGNVLKGADGFPLPDPMVDTYYDNKKLDAARRDMAIRWRYTAGNNTGAWNFKPGLMDKSKEGVAYRVEYGLDATDDKPGTIKKFIDSDHPLNPFKKIKQLVPGTKPSEYLEPSVKITDTRYKFKLENKNGLIIEISLDDVEAENLRNPKAAKTKFGQMEMDIDHLATKSMNTVSGMQGANQWTVAGTDPEKDPVVSSWMNALDDKAFLDGRPTLHDGMDLKVTGKIRTDRKAEFDLATEAIDALRKHTIGGSFLAGPQKYAVAAHALGMTDEAGKVVASKSVVKALRDNGMDPLKTGAKMPAVACGPELFKLIGLAQP